MKKILLFSVILMVCSSFVNWPCHPNGDIWPCSHRVHINDIAPCTHFDYNGYRIHDFDYYPCGHRVHPAGDWSPCSHYCN